MDQDQDHIRLTTSSQNTGLTRIYTYYNTYIELESNDFFTHFTGLRTIDMNYVLSREPPSFTNLVSLTYLEMRKEVIRFKFNVSVVVGVYPR